MGGEGEQLDAVLRSPVSLLATLRNPLYISGTDRQVDFANCHICLYASARMRCQVAVFWVKMVSWYDHGKRLVQVVNFSRLSPFVVFMYLSDVWWYVSYVICYVRC